jgi:glycosyltransferase involved in cell wall biosynthesis
MTQPRKVKLFIATPAYGHQVTTQYTNSLLRFMAARFDDMTFETMVHLQSGMALVTQARNNCVHSFMESDCEYLLFIDSDIGFPPEAIPRLVKRNEENVTLTPYPVKGYNSNGGLQFIVHFKNKEQVDMDDQGFVEITAGPTGFMMIHRKVFEKLAEAYPDKKTVNSQLIGEKVERLDSNWHTFFETDIHPEHGYLGEDIAFCNLWTKIGGTIFADAQTPLIHYGGHAFKGSLDMMFTPLEVDETEENK